MDEKLQNYVKKIQAKMNENESRLVAYIKDGRKLVSIGNALTRKEINTIITNYMNKKGYDEGDKFIIISYGFTYVNYLHGPMFMACEIRVLNDKGKVSMKNTKTSAIYYTVSDLKNRGFKRGDYKRLFNKLNNGIIESGLKKKYTAIHLD
jgi:hypothetical protein